jgi:hypothetical protein
MVKITVTEDNTLEVSGKTFDHKEAIKSLGGRWNNARKIWGSIENTPQNKKALKALTTKRHCGHCGEPGHTKPKCEKYREDTKRELVEKSAFLCSEVGLKTVKNYRQYKTEFCRCGFEDRTYGYEGFSVKMPVACSACSSWCCSLAHPEKGNEVTSFNFTCPYHGSFMEQLLNDTRGT